MPGDAPHDQQAPVTNATIEEIEGTRWPDPSPDDTFLIRRCLALRRKPLSEFTIEDLRIMIGQQRSPVCSAPRVPRHPTQPWRHRVATPADRCWLPWPVPG